MSKTWQLKDAKNRFSELIDKAIEEYDRMAAKNQGSLFDWKAGVHTPELAPER